MTYAPHGKHLIAGEWVATPDHFQNEPVSGAPDTFALGTVALVNRAAEAAEAALWSFVYASVAERAALLRTIADEIEVRGAAIT